jgi:hypothetical protein
MFHLCPIGFDVMFDPVAPMVIVVTVAHERLAVEKQQQSCNRSAARAQPSSPQSQLWNTMVCSLSLSL